MGRTACTEPQCLYKGFTSSLPYSRAIPLLPLWAVRPVQGLSACTRGALYLYLTVELYLYSLYGPYGLYRASVRVQGCTLSLPYSRAIPVLPLWAVRPVQSLSACTRGALYLYLTVELYLCSPYGPYGLYRASVPVQGCTSSTLCLRTKYVN